jgi:hypothetical protein
MSTPVADRARVPNHIPATPHIPDDIPQTAGNLLDNLLLATWAISYSLLLVGFRLLERLEAPNRRG